MEPPASPGHRSPQITVAEFARLVAEQLPLGAWLGVAVEDIGYGTVRLRQPVRAEFARPGGIVAGPIPFALIDVAMYALVLSVARGKLLAATTSINMHFLRATPMQDLITEGAVTGINGDFVFCRVAVRAEGEALPSCHATGAYALPREAG